MTPEVWKPVADYPDYEVSSLGRVRSLFTDPPRVLKTTNKHFYPRVEIKSTTRNVHVLVLAAFVGPRPDGMHIRHLDGNKDNPSLANLCYGTRTQNSEDAARHGTQPRGERHGRAVLTAEAVLSMRARWPEVSQPKLAAEFNIDQATVWRIVHRKAWAHV